MAGWGWGGFRVKCPIMAGVGVVGYSAHSWQGGRVQCPLMVGWGGRLVPTYDGGRVQCPLMAGGGGRVQCPLMEWEAGNHLTE